MDRNKVDWYKEVEKSILDEFRNDIDLLSEIKLDEKEIT